MAFYHASGVDIGTLKADVDMDDYQYRFVTAASTAGYFKLATGASNPAPLGVLQNDPDQGEPGLIRAVGVTKVVANAVSAIAFGDFLTSNASGQAIPVNASGPAHAIALEALASGSAIITALVMAPLGFAGAANA